MPPGHVLRSNASGSETPSPPTPAPSTPAPGLSKLETPTGPQVIPSSFDSETRMWPVIPFSLIYATKVPSLRRSRLV